MALSQTERLINWLKEVAVRRSLVEHATKREFLQMMGTTKLHGCYRLYAGKTYGRLFWLLVAISTGVIFVIVLAELTKQYRAENITTQVKIVYDYADGPSLTICSHNPVRRNYIEELKRTTTFSDELLMYLLHIFLRPEGLVKMDVMDMDNLCDGERLLQDYMFTYKNFTVESFVKEASFKCEEAFVQCAFEGSRIRQPFMDNFEPGFRLYVHDKDTISYVSSEILVVSPNNKLSAGLKPIKVNSSFLERSKGGTCRSAWPSVLRRNSTYSSSACKMACIARYFVVNCGCIPLQYNILKEGRLCSPKEVFDCISNYREIANIVHNVTYSPLCQDCAPECELFIYFTQNSIIHNILTSLNKYMENLQQHYKLSYVRNNLATAHVFFASKKYKMYSQSTLSDLSSYLSKIGSDMGLFYGASVISLFELILLLFKTIWALASSSRAVYLEEKAKREMERKLRIEEIINEYSIPDQMVGYVSQTTERPQRELDQMLSLTLTPEQANAILEAETFVDSIYVLLRRDKLTSTVEDVDSKRCVSVV
ncbi:amiloride-sensitive sodium channel family protein [Loa loa]|uniref:Amiloride-sensitive sodium channel family protein n=1 Tax=Loa loa TaxID=7209 RepID=A0A1S0UHP1_LOALO|nr:amiloride-sensitive sodium channel family protein [Loa loa]EJD75109.1 amiloride-sensitive sodium channel family protein [Loa loa]